MNSDAVFTTFLTAGIGLTQNRQRNAITTHGFNTCRALIDTSDDGIKEVFGTISRENRNINNAAHRVFIRENIKQRFYGGKKELLMRIECGAQVNQTYITGLTTNDVDDFVRKHNDWKNFKNSADNMSLPAVTVPKLTKSNWKLFSQSIKELLTRQRGTNSIPLIYVIRENTGNYDDVYASTEEQMISCIQLTGGAYRSDNSSVWSLLAENSTGTEAESIVNRFEPTRNGRAAWRALIAHMESTSYLDNVKSSAMAKLAAAHYNGEKKNFGIVKYYQLHSEAHNDLSLAGEPLSDGMKITHFLQGIKEDTAMNFAIASKAEPGIVTFEDFYNSFSAKLSTKLTLTQGSGSNSQRQINQVNSNSQGRGLGRGRGFSRGGRDNGGRQGRGYRGGRSNRGGRGGRFRYNPTQNQRWQPRAGDYSHDEWAALTDEQKQRVRDLRYYVRQSNNHQNGNNQGTGYNNQNRNIQQMNRDDASLPSQIQLPPAPSQSQPTNPGSNNGGTVQSQSGRAGDAFSSGGQTGRN